MDYQLIRPIGRGGMATVWEARVSPMAGLAYPVAMKIPHRPRILTEDGLRRFIREGLASLEHGIDHPNLVGVYGFALLPGHAARHIAWPGPGWQAGSRPGMRTGTETDEPGDGDGDGRDGDEGVHALVMELVRGATLHQLAGAVRHHHPVLRRAALAVIDALAFLHRRGLVHCDVSPRNILVGRRGVVKLADLGLASPGPATWAGNLAGVPAYMSPERLQFGHATPAADLYAVGAVLFHVLAGQAPYGTTAAQVLADHHRPPALPPHVPADLGALVRGLLARSPADRLTADRARAVLGDGGPVAGDAEVRTFVRDWLERHGDPADREDTRPIDVSGAVSRLLEARTMALLARAHAEADLAGPRRPVRPGRLLPAAATSGPVEPAGGVVERQLRGLRRAVLALGALSALALALGGLALTTRGPSLPDPAPPAPALAVTPPATRSIDQQAEPRPPADPARNLAVPVLPDPPIARDATPPPGPTPPDIDRDRDSRPLRATNESSPAHLIAPPSPEPADAVQLTVKSQWITGRRAFVVLSVTNHSGSALVPERDFHLSNSAGQITVRFYDALNMGETASDIPENGASDVVLKMSADVASYSGLMTIRIIKNGSALASVHVSWR